MIRVNVLPKELRPSVRAWLVLVPWKKVASSLLILAGFSSGWLWISNQILERSLDRLSGQWNGLQMERHHLEELESSLRTFKNRAAALKALKSEEAQWAPRLNLLTDAVVPYLWFTSLKFEIPLLEEEEPKKSASAKKGSRGGKASGKKREKLPKESDVREPPHLLLKGTYLVMAREEPALDARDFPGQAAGAAAGAGGSATTRPGAARNVEEGAPVRRFLNRLKEQPGFDRWFRAAELKSVEHRQIHQEEVSDFAIALYPTGR